MIQVKDLFSFAVFANFSDFCESDGFVESNFLNWKSLDKICLLLILQQRWAQSLPSKEREATISTMNDGRSLCGSHKLVWKHISFEILLHGSSFPFVCLFYLHAQSAGDLLLKPMNVRARDQTESWGCDTAAWHGSHQYTLQSRQHRFPRIRTVVWLVGITFAQNNGSHSKVRLLAHWNGHRRN